MSPQELGLVQALLVGHWPSPALTEEEQGVWARTLLPCDYGLAVNTFDAMAANGSHFRPTDGEFANVYRQKRASRMPALQRAEPVVSTRHHEWAEHCRAILRGEATAEQGP